MSACCVEQRVVLRTALFLFLYLLFFLDKKSNLWFELSLFFQDYYYYYYMGVQGVLITTLTVNNFIGKGRQVNYKKY